MQTKKVPSKDKIAVLDELFRKYRPMLLKFCWRRLVRLGSRQDRQQAAEDIVQTVAANILAYGSISQKESPLAYLFRVTANALNEAIQKEARDRRLQESLFEQGAQEEPLVEEGEDDEDADAETARQLEALDRAVSLLPDELRAFIELSGAGMSAIDIGALLEIRPARARRKLTCAHKELKRLVHEILQGRLS